MEITGIQKKYILSARELHLINSSSATALLFEDYTELTAMDPTYASTRCK
jgi:hypothetical protein